MGAQPGTIVPANRLGQLLVEARHRTGADLRELSVRSGGLFTVGELSDLEAGHRILDDALIREITSLYALDCGPIIPQRAELTIDLDRNLVSAAGKALPLSDTTRDHILDRYMSLVYVLRNREPGSEVPLREEDLTILAASLAERSELIEEQLLRAMQPANVPVNRLVDWFRSRLWVPGSGVLVAAVSVGTLVMVSAPDGGTTTETTDTVEPEGDTIRTLGAAITPAAAQTGGVSTPTPSSTEAPTTAETLPRADGTPDATATGSAQATVAKGATPAQVGAAAEALLPFDWQQTLPGWTINYKPADATFRGLTFPYEKSIDMYVRADDTPESLAGILAHELGHAIDVSFFDGDDRAAWLEARGAEGAQWWPDAYATDFQTGAGDFAEIFAQWTVGDASSSELAGEADADELAVMEELVGSLLRA